MNNKEKMLMLPGQAPMFGNAMLAADVYIFVIFFPKLDISESFFR